MQKTDEKNPMQALNVRAKLLSSIAPIPMIGWLLGIAGAVAVEYFFGALLAYQLYLPKIPALFGSTIALKNPELLPAALAYVFLIYLLPLILVARLSTRLTNQLAAGLERLPTWVSTLIHLALLYAALHIWSGISDYRLQVVKLTMIAVMLT